MKLKLRILDTYNNLCLKFHNVMSLFDILNNFVNLVFPLKSQFFLCNNVYSESSYKIRNQVKYYKL